MRRANVGWLGIIVCVMAFGSFSSAATMGQGNQAATALKPEALVGSYKGTATSPDGEIPITVVLKMEKGALGGTIESPQGIINVTGAAIEGDKVTLNIDMGGTAGTISGTATGSRIEGTWAIAQESGKFVLTRAADEPARPAADKAAASAPAPANGARPAAAADAITGQWDGVAGSTDMSVPFTMNLKLDGEKVTGEISSEQGGAPLSTGTWKNGALNLSFELGGMGTVTMVGAMQEGKLVGSIDVGGQMQMQWAAVRK